MQLNPQLTLIKKHIKEPCAKKYYITYKQRNLYAIEINLKAHDKMHTIILIVNTRNKMQRNLYIVENNSKHT
jgi:hypothetical protein